MALLFLFSLLTGACNIKSESDQELPIYGELADINNELQLGELKVPENHEIPRGKQIIISYVIIPSLNKNAGNHPLIYFTGGPGSEGLSSGRINYWLEHPVRDTRDIILMDQRGVGKSSALPNMHRELYAIMAKNASVAEELVLVKNLITSYKETCKEYDVDLSSYNSLQSAEDIGLLMKHLGYKKYNLYGTSYGTRLARVVQDKFPDLVNAVILNSPAPIAGDMLMDRLTSFSLALERLFDFCENNAECNQQYPDLEHEYLNAIEQLQENPIELSISGSPFYVNAQDAVYLLRRLLYATNSRSRAPALIYELANGSGSIVRNIARYEFSSDYNYSMWLAVERFEMFQKKNVPEVIEEAYASLPLLPVSLGFFDAIYQAGINWHSTTIPPEKAQFYPSNLPTIIFVNQYDPVTPPEYGQYFMETLSNGQLFVLDEGGHGGGNTTCRNKIMIQFMDNPIAELESSCLNIYKSSTN